MEQQDFVFEIKIPAAVMEMVAYGAKANGWQQQVTGDDGNPMDNPISAVQFVLLQTIQQLTPLAINAMAAERANEARLAAVEHMTALRDQWLASMQSN